MTEISNSSASNKLSYLWLVSAGVLFAFSNSPWVVPSAVWLAPVFMLRFLHTQKPAKGFIFSFIVFFTAIFVSYYNAFWVMGMGRFFMIIGVSIMSFIPYAFDRLIYRRLNGFLSTLAFPLIATSGMYFSSLAPICGSWPSIANTQYANLPLTQLVSITGLSGVSFLMCWFASTVNWVWEQGCSWERTRKGVAIYAAVFSAVLLYGGSRLAFDSSTDKRVLVAGITTEYPVIRELHVEWKKTKSCPPVERSIKELIEKTDKAAQSGARIIAWSEYTALIAKKDEAAYVKAGQELAKQHGIYLIVCVCVMGNSNRVDSENVSLIFGPEGKVLSRYVKSHLVPIAESFFMIPGKKEIPVIKTPYGSIASVICYDMDHPAFIRKASKASADIIIAPSNDWREIAPYHTYMSGFRAIENGLTVFRITGNGYTAAFNNKGSLIAGMDYFTTGKYIMIAELPLKRIVTLYSIIGDVFAWLSIIGLIVIIFLVFKKRQQQ